MMFRSLNSLKLWALGLLTSTALVMSGCGGGTQQPAKDDATVKPGEKPAPTSGDPPWEPNKTVKPKWETDKTDDGKSAPK